MLIRVDLPAPFSPSRAWISPGSTVRSMWSLATRSPKRLVMPRSSSLSAVSCPRCVPTPLTVELTAARPRIVRGPAAVRILPSGTSLGRAYRFDFHRAGDDVLLQLVHFGLQPGV